MLGLGALGQYALGQAQSLITEIVYADKWIYAWSDPVRTTYNQSRITEIASGPVLVEFTFPETVTVDRWLLSLTEPVRVKPGLSSTEQQTAAFVEFTFKETVTEDRWHQPWSEPARAVHPPLITAQQQAAIFPLPTAKETVTVDRWLLGLSEPVRVKPGLLVDDQSSTTVDTRPFVPFAWFNALSEPARPLQRPLPTSDQQAEIYLEPSPFPETVTVDRWLIGLSEPVRIKPGLGAWFQKDLSLTEFSFPETVSYDRWGLAWSEPVRVKPGLPAAEQTFVIQDLVAILRPYARGYVIM